MKKGYNWGIEWTKSTDSITGVEITKLVNYKGHSHHFYFTNPGWYDDDNKVVIGGDRNNTTNLFSVDLISGEITQLTDLKEIPGSGVYFQCSCINNILNEVNYWYDNKLWALSLETLEERLLWTLPQKQKAGMSNVTSDGKYVIFNMTEDYSDKIYTELNHGYIGFEEVWAYGPLCQIVRVPTDGSGKADILHSGNVWMGHLNTSPTQPTHLTFCHEGPWDKVDNRIWAMDTATGKIWPLRERRGPGESIGHEYWYADGLRVGYHGNYQGKNFLGSVKFDGTDIIEGDFPQHTWHVHSNDHTLAVGDGNNKGTWNAAGSVLLWLWNGKSYDAPRLLCKHRCSMHTQETHVHPCISPDNTYILYTSDRSGYGSPYIAKLPEDLSKLPFAENE